MNESVAIVAVIGGLSAVAAISPVADNVRKNLVRVGATAGWLGLVAGAVGIYVAQWSGVSLLAGMAGCAGLAVLPAGVKQPFSRDVGAGFGGLFPLVAGLGGMAVDIDIAGHPAAGFLLFAGLWGALGAAMNAALIAAALTASRGRAGGGQQTGAGRHTPGLAVAVAVAALYGATYLMGVWRGAPTGLGWSLPLMAHGAPLGWHIPASAQFSDGLWLVAGLPASWMSPVVVVGALAAMGAAIAGRLDTGKRLEATGWLVSAASALGAVGGLLWAVGPAQLPGSQTYEDAAARLLAGADNAAALIGQGSFSSQTDVGVSVGAMAPELAMLAVAGLAAVVAAAVTIRADWPAGDRSDGARAIVALHGRDWTLRSVAMGWLSWLLVTLIHWTYLGAAGMGSPAEWTALGALAAATGVVLMGWSATKRPPTKRSAAGEVVGELAPGVIFAVLLAAITLAAIFGGPFGLSVIY